MQCIWASVTKYYTDVVLKVFIFSEFTLCKDLGNVPALQVSDVDYSPRSLAQSAILRTPDSSQDLCPGCPGTCLASGSWMTATALRSQIEITVHGARLSVQSSSFCSATIPYCHAPQGSVFPLFALWSPTRHRRQRLQLC